ncbi:tRNA (adenosine(37)-N6)-threonylcarbamoyltransferase complex dimerization subunit type 1 TsaB [Phenylobacterium terrae]|uniref:tRNA (Adenosine(37)-N6)-threonylcarbamoyltransferase complex dimerization subunit type 1 TsaB n=1 Tax=Phenylobacterium terrae TaxID=2665495 RepID=A0ABW4MZX2_9CAUL
MVLGIDTCLGACAAAVLKDGEVLATRSEPMTRGHQERLAPLVREVMDEAGVAFEALGRVGVTVGPGSFTGLRVGLAFAKGLGAALDIKVAGVGALAALAEPVAGSVIAAIDAKRGQVYLQAFADEAPVSAPDVLAVETAFARVAEMAAAGAPTLVGPGAGLLAPAAPGARVIETEAADPAAVARLALAGGAARPLYLRAPDARLPGA